MPAQYIAKTVGGLQIEGTRQPIMEAQVAALEADDILSLGAYYFCPKGRPEQCRAIKAGRSRCKEFIVLAFRNAKFLLARAAMVPGAGIPANYPRLAGQWPSYTVEALAHYASGARRSTEMQAIASRMTPAEKSPSPNLSPACGRSNFTPRPNLARPSQRFESCCGLNSWRCSARSAHFSTASPRPTNRWDTG